MEKLALRLHAPLLGIATALLFLLAAFASRLTALQASGLEAVWPSNAIVLAILIMAGRDRRTIAAIAVGEALGSMVLHGLRGDAVTFSALLSLANVVESLLAFVLLKRMGLRGGLIDRVGNFFIFVAACAGAGLVSASIGAAGLRFGQHIPFWSGWSSWYVSGLLSALMVTPTVVILADIVGGRRLRGIGWLKFAELVLLLGAIAAVTIGVFYYSLLPSTFMVAPFVLFATFRLRAVGAVAGVSIVAIIAVAATSSGHGAIAYLLHGPGDRVMLLQAFIATQLLTSLPVAAVLSERDLQAQETRAFADHFRSVVENIGEVIFRIDTQGRWTYLNPAWETLTGRALEASCGRSWLELIDPSERPDLVERTGAVMRGEDSSTRRVVRLETRSGQRWVELFVQGLRGPDGNVSGATGTLRDIDDRKRLEEHVISAKRRAEQRARAATLLAATDELTGIANRRAFLAQLDREIEGAAEFGWPLAVAMFDVDHFKRVNDQYGHATGDRVLQLIAARAAAVVRGGDMVGRLGGEEFGILMPGASLAEAATIAERLREAMEGTGEDGEVLPGITISVGLAARDHHADAAALLADADVALYAAKDEGRNRVRIAA